MKFCTPVQCARETKSSSTQNIYLQIVCICIPRYSVEYQQGVHMHMHIVWFSSVILPKRSRKSKKWICSLLGVITMTTALCLRFMQSSGLTTSSLCRFNIASRAQTVFGVQSLISRPLVIRPTRPVASCDLAAAANYGRNAALPGNRRSMSTGQTSDEKFIYISKFEPTAKVATTPRLPTAFHLSQLNTDWALLAAVAGDRFTGAARNMCSHGRARHFSSCSGCQLGAAGMDHERQSDAGVWRSWLWGLRGVWPQGIR